MNRIAELERRLIELETRDHGVGTWQDVSFQNSWVNFGSGTNDAQYCKDSFGFVHLRGVVKSGTVATTIFQLPAGYRPSANERMDCVSNDAQGRIHIGSGGNVQLTVGSNAWVSLDGISFRVI